MSKNLKIILVVLVLAVLMVGGLLAYRYFSTEKGVDDAVIDSGQPIDVGSSESLDLSTWKDLADEEKVIDSSSFVKPEGINVELSDSEKVIADKAVAQQSARYFVEIFGSYSSDNNYQNLKDLQPLMTSTYWAKWEPEIKKISERTTYSIWSQAMNVSLDSYSNSAATATVLCKRGERKAIGDSENIFYQSAQVNLVKINNNWLVDKVTWLE